MPKSRILTKLFKSIASPTTAGVVAGGIAGEGLARWENEKLYEHGQTKHLTSLMGPGLGAVIGGSLVSPNTRGLGIAGLLGLLGMKQGALVGLERAKDVSNSLNAVERSISDYTKIQNDLADKNVEITKNQLAAAIQNKDIAAMGNETSKRWLDLANKGLPYLGGVAALLTALYAYNSFKKNNNGNDVALHIPEEKLSPQFYSRLGREILFKDKDEQGRIIRRKYIKDLENEGYPVEDLESFDKVAYSVDDVRKPIKSIQTQSKPNTPVEAKVEVAGASMPTHPDNRSWDTYIGSLLNKYGPTVLEMMGLITPRYQVASTVSFTDPQGRSRRAPSLQANSMLSDPGAVNRLYEYAINRSRPSNYMSTHQAGNTF